MAISFSGISNIDQAINFQTSAPEPSAADVSLPSPSRADVWLQLIDFKIPLTILFIVCISLIYRPRKKASRHMINIYQVLEELGVGAYGRVFKVENEVDKKQFALKMVNRVDALGINAIWTEMEIISKLDHAHIISYHSAFNFEMPDPFSTTKLCICIVMELATKDLATVIKEGCSDDDKHKYIKGIAAALTYIHHDAPTCVLHRDLKPENILIGMDGLAKLTDFGVSTSTDLDGRRSTAGTYEYAAPEMLKKGQTYNLPADIWAFGLIVLELILETRMKEMVNTPGAENSRADLDKVIVQGETQNYELGSLARACLQTEPSARPSAKAVLARLRE